MIVDVYIAVVVLTDVVQGLGLVLSNGPNSVGVSLLLPENGNQSSFQNVVFICVF
jgi:hypothetical protein